MPVTESKKQLGERGEGLACAELERQGMRVLERNWRCRLGEPKCSQKRQFTRHRMAPPLAEARGQS